MQQNPLQLESNQDDPDGRGRRKKGRPVLGMESSYKKLQILRETLKPIPFVPIKRLDFERHEKLLKRLHLWDFVHIEFDRSVQVDLLAQLIAHYCPTYRRSYVNGVRIRVSRLDLGRALKLLVPNRVKTKKKNRVKTNKKSGAVDEVEEPPEVLEEESVAFIEDFLSNWVLLHEEGTQMMPGEVLDWTKAIKEGHFGKVDWAGLIWFMVEKQLVQAPNLGNCYYASHLQHLIRSQREELFLVKEQHYNVQTNVEEGDEEDGNRDVEMGDFQGRGLEEHNIELCLGQENVEKVYGGQGNVEKVDDGQGTVEEVGVVKEQGEDQDVMDSEECKVEEPSQWLLNGKDDASGPFLRPCNLGEVDALNDNSHHALNGNKRLRTDRPWDSKLPGDFEKCMEQIQQWMGKARMVYEAKEQAFEQSNMDHQILLDVLQDVFIDRLQMVKNEEQQKRQKLEHELCLMGNLVDKYKEALKETQEAFSEYRARCPQVDEPHCRDVPWWISKFEAYPKTVELLSNRLLDVEKEMKLLNERLAKRRIPKAPKSAPNVL